MFDERHLQLVSGYSKASEIFTRQVIMPLLSFLREKIKEDWNKRANIELGNETYVLTENENGSYSWAKIDPDSNLVVPTEESEAEEVEEIVEKSFQVEEEYTNDFTEADPVTVSEKNKQVELVDAEVIEAQTVVNEVSNELETITPVQKAEGFVELRSKSSPDKPSHIEQRHWEEFVVNSAIDPEIATSNFKSLGHDSIEQSHEAWNYLIYSKQIPRTNTGKLTQNTLKTYAFLEETDGWWCNGGVDPRSFPNLKPGEKPDQKLWGCYKPDNPRPDPKKEGKFVKYEHPYKEELSIFLLEVPQTIAELVYAKAGVNPSQSDRHVGFWYSVWKYNIPVVITEGAKKAASILSQGDAAIALAGINAAYRSKNHLGERITPELRSEISVFATKDREIKICFDHDTKAKTVRSVNHAISTTGQLFTQAGSNVLVITLPGPEKGADDFIVSLGTAAFQKLSNTALPLKTWQEENKNPDLRFVIFLKNGNQIRLNFDNSHTNLNEQTTSTKDNKFEPDLVEEELSQAFKLFLRQNVQTRERGVYERGGEIGGIGEGGWTGESEFFTPDTPHTSHTSHTPSNWVKREQVTVYEQTIPRKLLEREQNYDIALAAKELILAYGIAEKDGSVIYRSDAFIIKKQSDIYSIHRYLDKGLSEALIEFKVSQNQIHNINLSSKQGSSTFLTVERQEFLVIASSVKQGKKLPSVDEDPRKIAIALSSLSPQGIHKILESFKTTEVLKILTHTLEQSGSDNLKLGNYEITFSSSTSNISHLKLIKTERDGTARVAVDFKLTRTTSGFTHDVQSMAITSQELDRLRVLAEKLQIQTNFSFEVNPNSTRDIPLKIHPALAKNWDLFSVPDYQPNADDIPSELTITEQAELYDKIFTQRESDILSKGFSEISLPPKSEFINDLMKQRSTIINENYKSKANNQQSQESFRSHAYNNDIEMET